MTGDFNNYQPADDGFGLKGALTSNYGQAMEAETSAQIMVLGMIDGWDDETVQPAPVGKGRPPLSISPRRVVSSMGSIEQSRLPRTPCRSKQC